MYQESIVYLSNNKTGICGSFYFSSKSLEMFTLKKEHLQLTAPTKYYFGF